MQMLRFCFVVLFSIFTNSPLLADPVYSADGHFRYEQVGTSRYPVLKVEVKKVSVGVVSWMQIYSLNLEVGSSVELYIVKLSRHKIWALNITEQVREDKFSVKQYVIAHEFDGLYRVVQMGKVSLSFDEFDLESKQWATKKTIVGTSRSFALSYDIDNGLVCQSLDSDGDKEVDFLVSSRDVAEKRFARDSEIIHSL